VFSADRLNTARQAPASEEPGWTAWHSGVGCPSVSLKACFNSAAVGLTIPNPVVIHSDHFAFVVDFRVTQHLLSVS
jgi:hypothetical protein